MGSIVFPPFTQYIRRRNLYMFSSCISGACCIVIASVDSLGTSIAMRTTAGLLSAVPGIAVRGSIEDIFNHQTRNWVDFIWALISNIGLVVGPIMSTYIIELLNWYGPFSCFSMFLFSTSPPGDGSSTFTQLSSNALPVFCFSFGNPNTSMYWLVKWRD